MPDGARSRILICAALALSGCAGMPDMGKAKKAYVSKDYPTALYHYEKLSEFGLPRAQTELGKMYLDGAGRPEDPAGALVLFEKAAARGDAKAARFIPAAKVRVAQNDLRSGVPQRAADGKKALEKLAPTAPEAAFALGQAYENGWGVAPNGYKADQYYQQASGMGHGKASFHRARLYERGKIVRRDPSKALVLYREAGDLGYARGYEKAGLLK